MGNKWILYLFFALITNVVTGQEMLLNLQSNKVLSESHKTLKSARLVAYEDTITLPMLDDFSYSSVYPTEKYWLDNYVYINDGYPINPVSIGVATFDAIDNSGSIYDRANFTSFVGDTLTSKPVYLSGKQNVFLSFFYQPGGRGEVPEDADSLVLQYYSPATLKWESVWRTYYNVSESSIHEIKGNDTLVWKPSKVPTQVFKQAIIQVPENYLEDGFQFRLLNYISLDKDITSYDGKISNADLWNLDYVRLGDNRGVRDTILNDIAFSVPTRKLLGNYTSMPWHHFLVTSGYQEYQQLTSFVLNNNYAKDKYFRRTRSISDESGKYKVYDNIPRGDSISALSNLSLEDYLPVDFGAVFEDVWDNEILDEASFNVTVSLETFDKDEYKDNDTMRVSVDFKNYYAYDDGTAEFGYGITGNGTENAMVALQYKTYKEDTLQSVFIYFNEAYEQGNNDLFKLTVWDNNDGQPGDTLYSRESFSPRFGGDLNGFLRYDFDTTLIVSDTFYIGWTQTINDFLNVGFDMNINNQNRLFYNATGYEWINSSIKGSLMLRPVLGSKLITDVEEMKVKEPIKLRVYPVPASDYISFNIPAQMVCGKNRFVIYNMQGQAISSGQIDEHRLDVRSLPPGIFFLQIESTQGNMYHGKFIVQ